MRPTVKLWEICDILDKKRKPITQKDRMKWIYPYYWASWVLDYVADYIFDEDLVLIWEDWAKWWALDNSAFKVSWKVWVNNHAHVIRPHREKIIDDFLVYFLVSSDLSDYITWTTVPKLNQERLKLIEIPLPPLEIQKAIVAKLDQIFAELDQTKSEIQKNLDNTDELWKSALNQAFQGDWEMKKLGEMAEIWDWLHWTPQYEQLSEYRFINGNNIKWWHINFNSAKYVSESTYNKLKIDFTVWRTVFMSINWTIWNLAFYNNEKIALWKSVCYFNIKYPDLSTEYLYYYLQTNKSKTYYDDNKTWNTIMNLWLKAIREYSIPVPPLSEQEKIVEHLDKVSKEVKELKSQYQSQLDNLEELKKSVLDKAFKWELGE